MAARITKQTYLNWYEQILLMRRFEEKAGMLYGQQKIRGFCHLYIGQEAVAAGINSALTSNDIVITAYRDHALALAKGLTANECMAEMFGKRTGCAKGKGGSMHFFDKEKGFYGGHGIVGAQIPMGAGIAFAEKYNGTKNVCITMFGDGAARQGALHETFNMAMTWNLPVVFIVENNFYAMGTSVERTSNMEDLYKLGLAYDMPSEAVDGMSVEDCHKKLYKAAEHARSGKGPYFLEVRTYRYKGHSMSDPQKYRTKEEVASYKALDPLNYVKEYIENKKWASESWFKEINDRVKTEVNECVEFAENSPFPDASEIFEDVYMQHDYPFVKH
ncbi:UNVERIFIED_CONTAM: hypothetical protein GTU68_002855 [Idotea baltica]|nr:hypothetical protein [Idotea baltica]